MSLSKWLTHQWAKKQDQVARSDNSAASSQVLLDTALVHSAYWSQLVFSAEILSDSLVTVYHCTHRSTYLSTPTIFVGFQSHLDGRGIDKNSCVVPFVHKWTLAHHKLHTDIQAQWDPRTLVSCCSWDLVGKSPHQVFKSANCEPVHSSPMALFLVQTMRKCYCLVLNERSFNAVRSSPTTLFQAAAMYGWGLKEAP